MGEAAASSFCRKEKESKGKTQSKGFSLWRVFGDFLRGKKVTPRRSAEHPFPRRSAEIPLPQEEGEKMVSVVSSPFNEKAKNYALLRLSSFASRTTPPSTQTTPSSTQTLSFS